MKIVIDANVVTKTFVPETLSDKAEEFFKRAGTEGAPLIAPDLIYPETGNILWKKFKRRELTAEEVGEIYAEIHAIPLLIVPSKSVVQLAISLALSYGITVYDALYLSVAQVFEAKLITADRKLVNSLKNTELSGRIEWLGSA